MAQKYSCFQSLAGKLPSWKSPIITQERVQSVPFTCIQHSRYPVSLSNLPRAHDAARRSKRKTVNPRVSLFPTSTKQMPAGLDFTVEHEFTGSFTEFPTDPALPGTGLFFNLKIWAMFPKSEHLFSPLPCVCTVTRHVHFYRTTRWVTADPQGLDSDWKCKCLQNNRYVVL